jgi:hypothetical protein
MVQAQYTYDSYTPFSLRRLSMCKTESFFIFQLAEVSSGSSVSIVSGYWLEDSGSILRVESGYFSKVTG